MKIENYLARHLGQLAILRQIALIKPEEVIDAALEAGPEEIPVGDLDLFQKKLLFLIRYKIRYGSLEERTRDATFLLMLLQISLEEKYSFGANEKLVVRKGFKVCVRPVSWGIPVPFVVFREVIPDKEPISQEGRSLDWTLN